MKTRFLKLLTLTLAALLCLSLVACGAGGDTEVTTTSQASVTPGTGNEDIQPVLDKELPVKIAVLSGTTGLGIAKLMHDTTVGEAELNYQIDVYSSADLINPGIITGEIAIAALPTNVASVLYKKTEGAVMVAAVNTKGVLYLLENGNTVNGMSDLKGKTVYLPGKGSNPEYIFRALCRSAGLEPDKDVILDYSYTSPDELATALASGLINLAVLPEPKVTAVKAQNKDIRSALDFTAEWNKSGKSELVQGCIVVQKKFAEEHPTELEKFLADYKASILFAADAANIDEAAAMIEEAGIIPKVAVAKKALPNCNICYMDGDEMKTSLSAFYQALYDIAPASIGGQIPDDGIYYKK